MGSLPTLSSPLCVLLSLILAYIPQWYRSFGVVRPLLERTGKPYDLRYTRLETTRATTDTPEGLLVARLTGCHQNGLEAFSYFGIAVVLAIVSDVPSSTVDALATLFVLMRFLYSYFYITGVETWKAPARSTVYGIGLAICATLLVLATLQQHD